MKCIGPTCASNAFYCVKNCPTKSLALAPNPIFASMGDPRWTPDMILATWKQAETGQPIPLDHFTQTGNCGGGFDRILFPLPPMRGNFQPEEISTAIDLNHRKDRAEDQDRHPRLRRRHVVRLDQQADDARPGHGRQGMEHLHLHRRGRLPGLLVPYKEHVITQIATGLFGVREETIQRAPIVEFKYAQGAKPGLGGHLLDDKNTPEVAKMREAVPYTSLFSPFPFHSVYSVEDHKKHLDWIHAVNPKALLSVKVSTPNDVEMVAVGSYYAGAHIVHLDGGYGGTGAAPEIAKKNIAHADRVRHPQGAPLPGEGGDPGRGDAHRQRRHADRHGHRQGHRPGRRRRGHRHRRDGGPGLRPVRQLRERPGLPPRHRHHRHGAGAAERDTDPGAEALQPLPRLADAVEGTAAPAGDEGHQAS